MSQSPQPVFRFAPSPNGALHLGHALSALIGFDMARAMGGRFLVRIEDIDTVRCPPHLIEAALADLTWLEISWEEPVLRQSEHFPVYRAAAERLMAMGLLYPCFATRGEIAAAAVPGAADPDGAPLYPGLWRNAPAGEVEARRARGEPFALRLDMDKSLAAARVMGALPLNYAALNTDGSTEIVRAHPERWGDAVIVRKDTPTSYHLAVVVDDARQGITHVTRGLDLLHATDLHRLLQALLGFPAPIYYHHRLIADETGRKLAKSAGDTALATLRAQGWTAARVRAHLGLGPAASSVL